MKRTHTFKISLMVLLFGVFLFANNTVKQFYNLYISDVFATAQTTITDLGPFAIDPTQAANSIFMDDFENTSNWTMINSNSNAWYIGNAIANGGVKSLYISNNKGTSNEYSNSTKTFDTSFAVSSVFTVPANSSDYVLSFDWRSNGEPSKFNDDISVWVIPSTYLPIVDTKMSTINSNGLLLKDQMARQLTFKKENVNVDLSSFAGQPVKLVIQWLNNNFTNNQPPAAIDNIVLYPFSCKEPSGLKVDSITQTTALLEWDAANSTQDYEVILTADPSYPLDTKEAVEVKHTNVYTYSNLKPSTYYYAWHRTVCKTSDKSYWVGPVKFMTVCGEFQLPFTETFNTSSATFECWSFTDVNKDATSPTGNNLFRFHGSSPYEGDRHVYFQGDSNITKHDDWLISPTFKLEGKTYKLTYFYKTSTSNDNEFEVLLSTNGTALTEFKTVLVAARSTQVSQYLQKTVYLSGITGNINLAWHVTASNSAALYIDQVELEEVACALPMDLYVDNLDDSSVELVWTDDVNKNWEYAVLPASTGMPIKGIKTAQKRIVATVDNNGNSLIAGDEYSYFVRAECGSSNATDWVGPFDFNMSCAAVALPFIESFDTNSSSSACWRVIDANRDTFGLPNSSNLWKPVTTGMHSGNGGYNYNTYATSHDDWLISPSFNMTGGIYQVTFFVKGALQNNNELEVRYSTSGTGASQFTKVAMPVTKISNTDYVKKVIYISGVTGKVNIGWHTTGIARSYIYLDDIQIEEVSCIAPDDSVVMNNLEKDKATFAWTDDENTEWEYYVMPANTNLKPAGSGTRTKNKTVTNLNTVGGASIVANTEYEFFVRSSCGPGKTSSWVGPYAFRTLCDAQLLPYYQGFENDDPTWSCWRIVDGNKDANPQNKAGTWAISTTEKQEGSSSIFFSNSSSASNDDWLISPTYTFSATKIYRVTYFYKPTTTVNNEMELLLSNQGVDVSNFTTEVVKKAVYKNTVWTQEKVFITGISGNVNLAFHVVSAVSNSRIAIDSFKVEEVENCVEPIDLDIDTVLGDKATLTWKDNFGATNWEYYVRKLGVSKLPPVGNGTAVSSKTATVTAENSGVLMKGNTEYEYFVRTICSAGKYSIWAGPFKFRTLCTSYTVPFWEGFNGVTGTMPCWTILDENKDAVTPTGNGIWKQVTSNQFEGSHVVMFNQTTTIESDDYLISPTLDLQPNKTYRIKFQYKATAATPNEMEIVASNSGTSKKDFKHLITPSKIYNSENYKEEIHYLTGLSGSVNIAWHLIGTGKKNIYIDNVFFDEVATCPQPIDADVEQVESDKATLIWKDDFGATNWEYIVQAKGKGTPSNADKGVSTTTKKNTVTTDSTGALIKFNTDYEYYVRTVCKGGGESLWSGPIYFTTTCAVYQTPYKEGFNKKEVGYRCWTILNENKDSNTWNLSTLSPYEGDQLMSFNHTGTAQANDWLISPKIALDGGMYVLKYHYRTNTNNQNIVEVKLSVDGTNPSDFKKELVKAKAYSNDVYKEEVVFINGIKGNVNIGWHAMSNGAMFLSVDNISLTKVVGCAEPYDLNILQSTATTIDLEWKQDGGITQWEVLVVEYGQPMPTGQNGIAVNGTPKTTLTNLKEGTAYQIYVRALCQNNIDKSEWSSAKDASTLASGNDTCAKPIVIPVNAGIDCLQNVAASTVGASKISVTQPSCFGGASEVDVWFEFTATSEMHELSFSNVRSLSGVKIPSVQMALYQATCATISTTGAPAQCYQLDNTSGSETRHDMKKIFRNLIPGQKYLLQIAMPKGGYLFNLCLTTSPHGYVSVSKQGDVYTTDQLIKEILISAPCDLVSNVKYQSAGKDGGETFGYFNQNNSLFPFKEGIVLATHDLRYIPGPYDFNYNASRGKVDAWEGDQDLNDVITNVGGSGFGSEKFVSTVEFDFVPINDAIRFEYLFTSQSYIHDCKWVCKPGGALFAAWLTEIETGDGVNLAVVPGTNEPIALSTIRDVEKSGADCESVNPEFYGNHYGNGIDDPLLAPINYIGMTKPMSSDLVKVKPGVKYRIKLAVADFCDWRSHTTAVFFNAQSFNLGSIELGDDLTIENGTAVCSGESKTIHSGMPTENVALSWYKDNVLIPGETAPDLVVTEAGVYSIQAKFDLLKDCMIAGEITVEMYPPLSELIGEPNNIEVCRFSNDIQKVNLTDVEAAMLAKVENSKYHITYFETMAAAELNGEAIANPAEFVLAKQEDSKTIYVLVEDLVTGCNAVFNFNIDFVQGELPENRENIAVCESYVMPSLKENQYYFMGAGASGTELKVGDVLYGAGVHQIYIYQDNGKGCYEESSFEVAITEKVGADVLADVEMECEIFVLPELSKHNRYFTGSLKQGTELFAGMEIYQAQRIYIYVGSEDGLCEDESSFEVRYADCPVPKGISPNGDGMNDTFDLRYHNVESLKIFNRLGVEVYNYGVGYKDQWHGQDKGGKSLVSGTYYYVIISQGKTKTGWVQINK